MSTQHPNYKNTDVIMTTGEVIKTRSTSHNRVIKLDIDIHTHPAWQKGKQNYVNQNASRVASFNTKFSAFNFLGKVSKEEDVAATA